MTKKANERFKEIRKHLGLSQAKFDKELGLPAGTTNNIDSGKSRVTPEIAKIIEDNFEINLRWLLFGEGNIHKTSFEYYNLSDLLSFIGNIIQDM